MIKKHHEDLAKALAKMEPDDWDKALEMLAIEKLGDGDTYFGEQFGVEGADQMMHNIKDDFPILHETDVEKAMEKGKRAGDLEQENKTVRDRLDDALAVNVAFQGAAAEFREKVARALVQIQIPPSGIMEADGEAYCSYAGGIVGKLLEGFFASEIVTAKAAEGVPLSDKEFAFLKEKLK